MDSTHFCFPELLLCKISVKLHRIDLVISINAYICRGVLGFERGNFCILCRCMCVQGVSFGFNLRIPHGH